MKTVLLLDFDRKRKPSAARMIRLLKRGGYAVREMRMQQSKHGWHVWISVSPAPRSAMEVIALQAILGSDPRREVMNVVRARKLWRTPQFAKSWWNVLYRPRELSRFPIPKFDG